MVVIDSIRMPPDADRSKVWLARRMAPGRHPGCPGAPPANEIPASRRASFRRRSERETLELAFPVSDAMLARLADPYIRARIRQKLAETGFTNFGRLESWGDVRIANSPTAQAGKTIDALARERSQDPLDVACDLMIADRGATPGSSRENGFVRSKSESWKFPLTGVASLINLTTRAADGDKRSRVSWRRPNHAVVDEFGVPSGSWVCGSTRTRMKSFWPVDV
jgi:hypothetical protein